jgi:hypothetical protein
MRRGERTLFDKRQPCRAISREHVSRNITTVTVQAHVHARGAKPEVPDDDFIEEVRRYRAPEADLVAVVC